MTIPDENRLRNSLNECFDKYENSLRILESSYSDCRLPLPKQPPIGRDLINEAQVRACAIDPILRVLGWNISSTLNIAVEDPVTPLAAANEEEVRFLDYHGRVVADTGACVSLLLVEAKRASVALPNFSDSENPSYDLAGAIDVLLSNKKVKAKSRVFELNATWEKFINTLCDYVRRVHEKTGEAPLTAIMSNGDWFLIFTNPKRTFIDSKPGAADIEIYQDHKAVLSSVSRFAEPLSYIGLSKHIPVQLPDALMHYVQDNKEKVEAVFGVKLSYLKHGETEHTQPAIAAYVYIRICTPNGALITFCGDDSFIPLRSDAEEIEELRKELTAKSQDLLRQVRKHADVILLPVEQWVGIHDSQLCQNSNNDLKNYDILTGEVEFIINDEIKWDTCKFHDSGKCSIAKKLSPFGPIYRSSVEPRVFFASGSPLHCSHATVHALRDKVNCLISGFEQSLCCRRCAFFNYCYRDKNILKLLPCEMAH